MKKTQDIINKFFRDRKRLAKETVRGYEIALRQFFKCCGKGYDQVTVKDIRSWLATLDQKGLKPRSMHLKLAALKSFYRYCLGENLVLKDPTLNITPPKLDDSPPAYLEQQDLARLMEFGETP